MQNAIDLGDLTDSEAYLLPNDEVYRRWPISVLLDDQPLIDLIATNKPLG
jgi:hypothetical protein